MPHDTVILELPLLAPWTLHFCTRQYAETTISSKYAQELVSTGTVTGYVLTTIKDGQLVDDEGNVLEPFNSGVWTREGFSEYLEDLKRPEKVLWRHVGR